MPDDFVDVDSLNTTQRAKAFNSVMSLVVDRISNEVACVAVPYDFSLPDSERALFVGLDAAATPDTAPGEALFRNILAGLFHRFLGVEVATDSIDVDEALGLWRTAHQVGQAVLGTEGGRQVPAHCHPAMNAPEGVPVDTDFADPGYTVRAWMAVVTYLVRQPEFILSHR